MTLPEHQDMSARPDSPERFLAMEFTGSGGEYFRIWIVNIALSVITLGIYSAWAKVRAKRYFYGNTRLDGSAFAYHATPMMVLKGRLVAVGVLLVYVVLNAFYPLAGGIFYGVIVLLLPWAVWKSIGFNARMSSYRNVRFAFRAPLDRAYIVLLALPFAAVAVAVMVVVAAIFSHGVDQPAIEQGLVAGAFLLPLGILALGLIEKMWAEYYVNHHRFGQGRFAVSLSFKRYLVVHLKMLAVGILIVSLLWLASLSNPLGDEAFGWLLFAVIFVGLIWVKAYLQTRLRNYIYSRATLAPAVALYSWLKVGRLFWIYLSNTVLLICTLGFAYPWLRVRVARYLVDTVGARFRGDDLDAFFTQMQPSQSALGEELGEAFDFDVGLGV